MAPPATEIAMLPILPGAEIEDPNSSAGKVWQSSLDTIAAQPGYQGVFWGRQIENNSILVLLVDWDDIAAHKNFMNSPSYGPFVKHMRSIFDDTPAIVIYHAELTPHPPSAAVETTTSLLRTSPGATEIAILYLDPSISSSDAQAFEDTYWKFSAEATEKAEGFVSTAGGWIVEDLEHEKAGGKAKGYCVLIGWQSVEKHTEFRDTEAFKGIEATAKYIKHGEQVHVKFVAK